MQDRRPSPARTVYVGDGGLSYERSRYRGGVLELDRAYRLMHLPLVNPNHKDVVRESEDGDVKLGRFPKPRKSLVAFIDRDVFGNAAAVGEMIESVAATTFGQKIDFQSFEVRMDRLHFTLSPLQNDDDIRRCREAAASFPPFSVRVAALWAGASINSGRFYLPVYPERSGDENVLHTFQAAAGLRQSDFFGLGFFNLTDHLSDAESAELLNFIDGQAGRTLFETRIAELAVIETFDSLLLDYRIAERLALN